MAICSKSGRTDDVIKDAIRVETEYIETHYEVIIREESDGGYSHTEKKHGVNVTRKYLNDRLISQTKIPAATKFVTREALSSSRHKWLAAYATSMHAADKRVAFERTLDTREVIGEGIRRNGQWAGDFTSVTFTFAWSATEQKWCEVRGFPSVRQPKASSWTPP